MDFSLSDEELALQETARRFAQAEIAPVAAEYDQTGEFPRDVIEKAWELGLSSGAIPQAYANEMLYLGRRLSMEEALQWGVISRLVPQDQLLPTAQEMAAQVAGYAPIAVRAMKELINAQGDMTIAQANRFGGSLRWIVGQTADSKEGPRAFAEGRQPDFKGE